VIKPELIRVYDRVLRHVDPILDLHLVEILEHGRVTNQAQLVWSQKLGAALSGAHQTLAARRRIRGLWQKRTSCDTLPPAEWLWAPVNRVPKAARPSWMKHKVRGELGRVAYRDWDPEETCKSFHGNTDEEITTMELFARCSYEHALDMPATFHHNMARQVADESRHALACIELMAEYGHKYGDYPISTGVYDFHYQFELCEPGSRRELLWRLLLRSTLQEALSLDGFVLQIKKREYNHQSRIARLLESVMSDEVFHVNSGLRWSRYICDGNEERVLNERDQAHSYYASQAQQLRKEYVLANPERAIAEVDFVRRSTRAVRRRYPFSLEIQINREARRAAGFSEAEIDQVLEWGYALP
jgi:uncharacterized ferritin-like protein (DUF455 family)